ncbi:MAG: shikimate dehydrogenase [Gluconacetobacter diazotrophicus]|nr:shikimate dehydrogenase [Gluconacetobacter diazotrophicus]
MGRAPRPPAAPGAGRHCLGGRRVSPVSDAGAIPIDGTTPLAGVIGWPVAHSCSPFIHNEWLRRLRLPGAYVPLPVRPGELRAALHGLRAAGFRGVNVTAPHKEEAFGLCDRVSDTARRCGAANTLVFDADGIGGDNSDGAGFLLSLRAAGVEPRSLRSALLLGAGGAARAVAVALEDQGIAVSLCNRGADRAAALARDLDGTPTVLPWETRHDAVRGVDLLVNTTSLGTGGQPSEPVCRLDAAFPHLVVADIVYRPADTPLLRHAAARGLRTVGGLWMLIGQATVGFERWFGAAPSADRAIHDHVSALLAAAAS